MIEEKTYSKEWITEQAAALGGRIDPKLMEKVVYAFGLLEQLAAAGLSFVFKGGTALLLLSGENPQRLSIDIDIITETKAGELGPFLDNVVASGLFKRWEDDSARKTAPHAPVAHYKFYYNSVIDGGREEPILLDLLFSLSPYASVENRNIEHPWLVTSGTPLQVAVPDYSSLTGDKLTAFAPNTIGILYSKDRPAEIMKQLFDLGFLCGEALDLQRVRESYIRTATDEIAFRALDTDWKKALQDTFDTCLLLTQREEGNAQFQQLLAGNRRLVNFILRRYALEDAIRATAKVAYLVQLILTGTNERSVYTDPEQVKDLLIEGEAFRKLQKLKKGDPEAFFYWYHAMQLRSEQGTTNVH